MIDVVQGPDFYRPAHQRVFEACARLYLDRDQIDYLTVTSRLRDDGLLDEAGGEERVVELASATPTPFHVETYAQLVAEAARKRALIQVATDVVTQVYRSGEDTTAIVESAMARLDRLARDPARSQGFMRLGDALPAERDRIEEAMRAYAAGDPVGLPTNWPVIDRAGLLMRGELVLLAAEPGVGKTALLLNLIQRYAARGIGVMLAEFEMSTSAVLQRVISALSGVWATRLRTGQMGEAEYERAVKAMGRIDEWPVYELGGAIPTVVGLGRDVRRQQRQHPCEVLLVDYMQLMPRVGHGRETEADLVGQVSQALKRLAYDEELLVVAVSSLNRQGQRAVDALDRLRGSGQLGFDADWVLTMAKDPDRHGLEYQRVVARQVTISKARHGQSDVTQWLAFDKQHQVISPIEAPDDVLYIGLLSTAQAVFLAGDAPFTTWNVDLEFGVNGGAAETTSVDYWDIGDGWAAVSGLSDGTVVVGSSRNFPFRRDGALAWTLP